MESVGHLLRAFRTWDLEIFRRTCESVELVPAQDIEMDCFGFGESQWIGLSVSVVVFTNHIIFFI